MTASEQTRQEYERAFDNYTRSARQVRLLVTEPVLDASDVDTAIFQMELARTAYVRRRDTLAEQLSPALARVIERTAADSPHFREARVRTLAELFWEAGGRREGTALNDWQRAEDVIRRASAVIS